MSAPSPYFCTRCGREHVRGAIYQQHQQYDRALQAGIDAAAIPADVQPLPKLTAVVGHEVVNTAEYNARMAFHKDSPCPDRVVESMQQPETGRIDHGQAVTKKHWWQFWRRT